MFGTALATAERDTPVDQVAGDDLATAFDDDLEASVVEIHNTVERLGAERARRIAEVDRRGLHRALGHPSTAS